MLLKTFYDEKLAQASYLVGCQASGEAVVIDPARDITPYLRVADENDLRIVYVTETHIHADFVSGTRELAHAVGAHMLLSDEGGEHWSYHFPVDDTTSMLYHDDTFFVGEVRFHVLHTPGHTPEHLSFVVTDTTTADEPYGIFTGDCLFVGSVGRPDLLETATGDITHTADDGARQQFQNVQAMRDLPDYLQVLPGHGAGSTCGKALGALPSTTIGYERRYNPAFQYDDEDAFITWLLDDQPEMPQYVRQMKQINKQGAALLLELPQAQHITGVTPDEIPDIVPDDALFIDTRPVDDFATRHIPGSINIPINAKRFPTYVGYYVDYAKPTFFVAYQNDIPTVLTYLFAIGVDDVPGYFTSEVVQNATGSIPQQTPRAVHHGGYHILDVRSQSEYNASHVPDVQHIHMSEIPSRLDEIPREKSIAVQCGGGLRSQVVASLLKANGFENVINISGGIDAWKSAGLPTTDNNA